MGKNWWQSKTVWTNVLAFVATVLSLAVGFDLDAVVQAEIVAAIMAIVNIVLRFITEEPIL